MEILGECLRDNQREYKSGLRVDLAVETFEPGKRGGGRELRLAERDSATTSEAINKGGASVTYLVASFLELSRRKSRPSTTTAGQNKGKTTSSAP